MPDAIISQLIIGSFTLGAALGGALLQHCISHSKRRKSVRQALLTEVESIISIIANRDYREEIAKRIQGERRTLSASIPDSYRTVYDNLISDIGLLNAKEARDLITFYMLILAVVEDCRPGGTFSHLENATAEAYQEALGILDQALEVGNRLISRR